MVKKTSVESARDLPTELWWKILSTLPVKPLLRFRCVSKTWKSMLDDPAFRRFHLHSFSNNRQQTHVFVAEKEASSEESPEALVEAFWNPYKSTKIFRVTTDLASHGSLCSLPTRHARRKWEVVCSIDGLFMLVEYESFDKHVVFPSSTPKLLLWNPSIRKSRVLPRPPRLSNVMSYVEVGFGFDPSINDYKHVRIACLDDHSPQFVAIYTVGLGSWKKVPFLTMGRSSCRWRYHRSSANCPLHGRLFSIAFNWSSKVDELVSFDLSKEVFISVVLPGNFTNHPLHRVEERLTVVNGVCLFAQYSKLEGSVWSLEICETDSESMHWTKRYSIGAVDGILTLLSVNSNEEGLAALDNYLEDRDQRHLIRILSRPSEEGRVFDYFESLMLLK